MIPPIVNPAFSSTIVNKKLPSYNYAFYVICKQLIIAIDITLVASTNPNECSMFLSET